ncbi:MAG: phage major capsid protein [bacterium]|nr:phage major capsid protein [bacterium]
MASSLDNIDSKLDRLVELADKKGQEPSNIHLGGGNRELPSISYFQSDPQLSRAKAVRGRPFYRNAPLTVPQAYADDGMGMFKSFGDFCRVGMRNEKEWTAKWTKGISGLKKALPGANITEFEDGGALVLPEYSPEILRMVYEGNGLWQRTRSYTVTGNSMAFPRRRDTNRTDGNRHGGALGYWLGEADAITESQVKFDSTDIKLDKLAVAVFITEEMLSDSGYAIEQFIIESVQEEIDYQLDRALLRGKGSGAPVGILESSARIAVPKETSQTADTIVSENLSKMWARRLESTPGADLVWLYNQDIEPQLHKLFYATGANSGQLTYMPPGGLSESPYATLMGRPMIPTEHCSTLGDEGDIMLCDFKYYLSVNKGQINQVASPHVQFLRDLLCIKFTFRISGRPMYDTPITFEQSAQTRSPFITLATRA